MSSVRGVFSDNSVFQALKIDLVWANELMEGGGGGGIQLILRCRNMSENKQPQLKNYTPEEGKSLHFLKAFCLLFPKSLMWNA